ncbi:hypothetical protein DFP72DRAFT_137954 [Ephemerocybe angulata]|uniref:Uncharacterized protein n=1 Tax=Ephemerocybe angulata TaxID=980116 RepID=A0A8H6HA66_9AGAR|nr:hypothetical protein DFP72DRAFT_137954 [Tulosesus angulatus]
MQEPGDPRVHNPDERRGDDAREVRGLADAVRVGVFVEEHACHDLGEELCHGEQNARVPRQHGERHENQVEKERRHHEYRDLRIAVTQRFGPLHAMLVHPALLQRALPRPQTLQLHGHVPRRPVLRVLRRHIPALLDQPPDAHLVPAHDRPVQRRQPRLVLQIRIRAVPQQQINAQRIALVRRPHERRVPLRVARVHADRLVQQIQQRHNATTMGDEVQGVVALAVGDGRVRAVRNEQVDDVEVAVARGPLHGRRDEVAPARVDVRALLEQVAACGDVGVDRRPVQRRHVLLVAVRGGGAARLDELAQGGYVSSLCSDEDAHLHMVSTFSHKCLTRTSSCTIVCVCEKEGVAVAESRFTRDADGGALACTRSSMV